MRFINPFKHTKYRTYKLLNKIGLLKYINTNSSKTINGITIKIPVVAGNGYQNILVSENWAIELYKRVLSVTEGAFIDVGVNNGQTLIKIASLDKSRTYLGFEPNPVCYNYTRALIRKNNFSQCILFPVGLFNENTVLPIFHDTEYASGASVMPKFRKNMSPYKTIQQVALMRGDEILQKQNLENIAFIKADVEGAELEVVEGLQQTIQKYLPVILLEILPVYSLEDENGKYRYNRQQKLIALLKEMNYIMFLIDEKNISLKQLEEIEVHGDMGQTNYLFTTAGNKEKILQLFKH